MDPIELAMGIDVGNSSPEFRRRLTGYLDPLAQTEKDGKVKTLTLAFSQLNQQSLKNGDRAEQYPGKFSPAPSRVQRSAPADRERSPESVYRRVQGAGVALCMAFDQKALHGQRGHARRHRSGTR